MSSGLRSTSSSPSRKSMRPFSGKDSLELQRRNPSRVPASGGMRSGSLTWTDGFLGVILCLPSAIIPPPCSPADEVATHWVLDNIYDSLVTFDADMHVRPALAAGWDNPDDLTWRFQLRPGVRFQNGRPVGAADVVVSLERARSHPQSKMSGYLVEVAAVRAVDRHTVQV